MQTMILGALNCNKNINSIRKMFYGCSYHKLFIEKCFKLLKYIICYVRIKLEFTNYEFLFFLYAKREFFYEYKG